MTVARSLLLFVRRHLASRRELRADPGRGVVGAVICLVGVGIIMYSPRAG